MNIFILMHEDERRFRKHNFHIIVFILQELDKFNTLLFVITGIIRTRTLLFKFIYIFVLNLVKIECV